MTDVAVRAPGRVNLIGEHVDYCGGAVLPLVLDRHVTVRAVPRDDGVVTLRSEGFDGVATIEPDAEPRWVRPLWARYAAGALATLRDEGFEPRGFDAHVTSELPSGAGLASSAAFGVAFVRVSQIVSGHVALSDLSIIAVWRDAEQRGTGVRCGIMDPYAALRGTPGEALLLDCAEWSHRPVRIGELAIVVADSGARHELAETEYNRRRAECDAALAMLRDEGFEGEHLADLHPDDVDLVALPAPLDRRTRHVVREHARTLAAAEALARPDLERFGALLDASHESLRDDYQVSCPELDALVDAARAVPGVYGSRMTGGGFGGCTVTAVRSGSVDDLVEALRPIAGPAGVFRVA